MYLTLDDLLTRFTDIERAADHDGDGEADSAVIAKAIADACGEMDGYLRVRYALPLTTVPDDLVKFGCDIARWHIYGNAATELVRVRYERAVNWLKDVAAGRVGLPIAPISTSDYGGCAISAPARVFTDTLFANY